MQVKQINTPCTRRCDMHGLCRAADGDCCQRRRVYNPEGLCTARGGSADATRRARLRAWPMHAACRRHAKHPEGRLRFLVGATL
jgi:hypothetical protein